MVSSREETSSSLAVTEATTVTTSKADVVEGVDSVAEGVVRARRVGRGGAVRSRIVERARVERRLCILITTGVVGKIKIESCDLTAEGVLLRAKCKE